MKSILFIINPNSGTQKKSGVRRLIQNQFQPKQYDIEETRYAGHAKEIAASAVKDGRKVVVAVGGDGTVNEIASVLTHSQTALGIIPMGSGNGLARHLKIPTSPAKALDTLKTGSILAQDTLMMDTHFFVNMAGLGFDAIIAHRFANLKKRGLISYIKSALACFKNYQKPHVFLKIQDEELQVEPFLITFANGSQYGNEARIVPHASTSDGWFESCILSPFPIYSIPRLVWHLFSGHMDRSVFVDTHNSQTVRVQVLSNGKNPRSDKIMAHVDGEPCWVPANFEISIFPGSLKMVVPGQFMKPKK